MSAFAKEKARSLFSLALFLALALAACGVKGWPEPMTRQNPPRPELTAATTAQGVEVRFTIPEAGQADKVISQVIFSYAYLPLEDDPGCPTCPPTLNSSRIFSLAEGEDREARPFVMVDDEVPYGQQAVYQAIWQDKAGRRSPPSALVYGYNLSLPPPPLQVAASTLQDHRQISWPALAGFSDPLFGRDQIAYQVERRGPEGVISLNQRPMSALSLNDYSANPSRTYRYRVRSLRVLNDTVLVMGQPGAWVKAAPFGRVSSLEAPRDLLGVSLPAGVYLRFEPVADPEVKGYIIERRQEQSSWQAITPEDFAENTFVDRQAKSGQYYEYRVIALDEEGDSSEPGAGITVLYLPEEEAQ
jgi:hypothetical protein